MLKSGELVVQWGAPLVPENEAADAVLAYLKTVPEQGGLVLLQDGWTVKTDDRRRVQGGPEGRRPLSPNDSASRPRPGPRESSEGGNGRDNHSSTTPRGSRSDSSRGRIVDLGTGVVPGRIARRIAGRRGQDLEELLEKLGVAIRIPDVRDVSHAAVGLDNLG